VRREPLLRFLSLYPPLAGAGVRVRRIASDPLAFESRLRLRWWNRNWFGAHYGGSLYTMTDPFYAIILAEALGRGYLVADKAASIRYRRPGRGTVRARFEISPERIDAIRRNADEAGRDEPTFLVRVLDEVDQVVAEVEKRIVVRSRDRGTG